MEVSFQQWFALCCSLPKLRYLLIFDINSDSLDDFEYLFQIRPLLRIIVHNNYLDYNSSVKYFKDVVTNTIIKISPNPSDLVSIYEGIPQKYVV